MKLFKKRVSCFVLCFVFTFLSFESLLSVADWTVLIYVQAKNNLNKFAAKNLADMSKSGSNKNLNILVQWYQPNQKGVWRYKINQNKIELDTYLPSDTDGNHANDLVDSMKWAVNNYQAKKYSLILWNHGVGILDPTWGALHSYGLGYNMSTLSGNPRTQIEDLTVTSTSTEENDEPISEEALQFLAEQEDFTSRGILFNESSRTYMNNQELISAMNTIKTQVLKNKKIDLLGMDACLMAMLEMAYQLKGFAHYMVASQEVELAYGWDYKTVMATLSLGNMTAENFAKSVVLSYQNYYKNRIQFYTQSAITLENVSYVKDSLDQISNGILSCKKLDKLGISFAVKEARRLSLQFSAKSYIDLHSFYSNLRTVLENKYNIVNGVVAGSSNNDNLKKYILNLYNALNIGRTLIEKSVISHTAGNNVLAAKGLSIYFPLIKIDNSYKKTEFAKDSQWINFLNSYFEK